MDIKELFRILRRRYKFILVCLILGLVGAGVYSAATTPMYESTSRLFVSTKQASDSSEALSGAVFSQQRVASYADLATGPEVMQRVIDRLGLKVTPNELAKHVHAEGVTTTVILEITADDPDPYRAQAIARAEAEVLTAFIAELEKPSAEGVAPIRATIADPASLETNPFSPRTGLNLAVAGLLGLLIGVAGAILRDLFDTTVKSPEDYEKVTESPVMATVTFDSSIPKAPLITDERSHNDRVEAFRVLRTNLQFVDLDATRKTYVVTSAVPGEGKTMTATNLAITLAQSGRKVLLIDGDLRKPKVAELLGLENSVGLLTVLVGRAELHDTIQHHSSGLHFLATGPQPPNPAEILQTQATQDLFAGLREDYDIVIVDAPPLLPVADAAIIAAHSDGVLLVARHGRTSRDQLQQAATRLSAVGARLIGGIVNMTPRRNRGNGYSYGYGYGYGEMPLPGALTPTNGTAGKRAKPGSRAR